MGTVLGDHQPQRPRRMAGPTAEDRYVQTGFRWPVNPMRSTAQSWTGASAPGAVRIAERAFIPVDARSTSTAKGRTVPIDPPDTAAPRAAVTTLNVSVEQIESDLQRGQTVQQIAQDWSEPVSNVLAVKRAMEANGHSASRTPGAPVPGARPAASVSPMGTAPAALSVDALVAAAARSTSKRTQALAVRLADLAKVVRDRLREEREAAEKAEAQKAEREAARAEVERLEAQLRAARAKLSGRPARQGGGSPVQRDAKPVAKTRTVVDQQLACRKGCGRTSPNPQGRAAHERHCTAVSS